MSRLDHRLKTLPVKKSLRYVDNFLIVYSENTEDNFVDQILDVFENCGSSLQFTFEKPKVASLQFLDLSLSLHKNHLSWSFSPRSKKGILHYTSSHSKVVKRGIALFILE